MDEQERKKNRKYNEVTLKSAIEDVLQSRMTVYRASQEYKVPWSTLKANINRVIKEREEGKTETIMLKVGRPYSLSVDYEQKLYNYIIKMQELGFGLTVNQIRRIAFSLAEASGQKHFFNEKKQSAGWNWWVGYKERYGLSLRTPENLSAGRAICSNPIILADFYEKLEQTLLDHNIKDSPERIWNCDETGLMYVNKASKIVTKIGKKYVYNRTYAEKGTTTTVLACINAAGHFLPPLVIFKGVRNIPALSDGAIPNSLTRMSPKGWINADLFYEWLQFFDKNISPVRPVMLIMDSHASHITQQVLEFAQSRQIILFTMPAHTSHILQPLDVGVFRSVKAAWREELQNYKTKYPNLIPTRYHFHKFLTPVYEKCFTLSNIRAGFSKSGIYPLNKNAVCPEATAPSTLSDQYNRETIVEVVNIDKDYDAEIPHSENIKTAIDPLCEATKHTTTPGELSMQCAIEKVQAQDDTLIETLQMGCETTQTTSNMVQCTTSDETVETEPKKKKIEILDILVLPKWEPNITKKHKRAVPKAQCLTSMIAASSSEPSMHSPPTVKQQPNVKKTNQDIISCPKPLQQKNIPGKQKKSKTKKTTQSAAAKSTIINDDWMCRSCNKLYSKDVELRNGAKWISCSFCTYPYHIHCQSQDVDEEAAVFMCDLCSYDGKSSDEE